jgi:hypothetical protein
MDAPMKPGLLGSIYAACARTLVRMTVWTLDKPGVLKFVAGALTFTVGTIVVLFTLLLLLLVIPLLLIAMFFGVVLSLLRSARDAIMGDRSGPDYTGDDAGRKNVRVLPSQDE